MSGRRSWVRNASRIQKYPDEVLIAGEDFPSPAVDRAWLEDSASDARRTIDPRFVQDLVENGFTRAVSCVAYLLPGQTEPVPVVIGGRRYVRHCRAANRALEELEQPRRRVVVNLLPAALREALDRGRVSLTAARFLADHPDVQAEVLGGDGRVTIADVHDALGEARGRPPRRTRPARDVKRALEREDLPEQVRRALCWVRGEVDTLIEEPEE